MRLTIVITLVCGLLMGVALPAVAQDEATAEPGRVAVPEAGVALIFPADWSIDVEMRAREDWGLSERYEDAAPLTFWNVLYASAAGRPWCDLTWYPQHPMTLAEHAVEYEALMTPSLSDVQRSIEVSSVELPAGEAYRFDIYNAPTESYSATYLLGSGASRYILECMADTRDETDWLSVAETIEWLVAPEP